MHPRTVQKIKCDICPHNCVLKINDIGKCQVIQNIDGELKNTLENQFSHVVVDRIEKKPFFHFLPGSVCVSVGGYGCSLSCKFCQNYKVSQTVIGPRKTILSSDLIDLSKEKNANIVAFTFNEPTLYWNYICQIDSSTPIVIKTNGYASKWVLDNLCVKINAFNIDIKGDEQDYQNICDGHLQPVLDSIISVYNSKKHLEICFLVYPHQIDNIQFFEYIARFLSDLNSNIPVHILYFYPFYQMEHVKSYHFECLIKIHDIFKKFLSYVYISNSYNEMSLKYRHTYCKICNSMMIERDASVILHKLECCNQKLQGIFQANGA